MTSTFPRPRLGALTANLLVALALSACGGGDDDDTAAPAPAPAPVPVPVATTTFSGAIVKGPVSGASVCAYAVAAAARGAALGACVLSDASGLYTLTVPVASGPVWLEASGGSYTDEATAAPATMPAGSVMAGLVAATGATTSAFLTPLTTVALNAARAGGTLDIAAFDQAVAAMLQAWGIAAGLDVIHTAPIVSGTLNDYGQALLNISRMVAAGLPLADILASAQPQALAAAYAAAAAGPVTPPPSGGGSGGGAELVIAGATPASLNGVLDKAGAQFESNSSTETLGNYQPTDPYCRVAAYTLTNSGDGQRYFIELSFSKTTGAIGLLVFGDDATFATLARVAGAQAAVSIDTVHRRITFTDLTLQGTVTVILNGTLEYPTNVEPANRAACG